MTQADDTVSVIVPAYNAAATIGETLRSCLAQTHRELEVIVVDDGSTDGTAEIVRSFVTRDPRVRLLQQRNAGVAAARNLAIAHAEGAHVAPLDADDLWHPEKISLQVAAMRQGGPRVGVVYCWRRLIDVTGRVIPEDRLPYPHEGDVLAAVLLGNIPGNGSVPLIRRGRLLDVGGFDTSLLSQEAQGCEDLQLYVQLAERYHFALVPLFLVGYRSSPENMSSDPRRISRSEAIVLEQAQRRHPELPARLFRLAIARAEFRAAQRHLRRGMLIAGLIFILKAVGRDPVAMAYRLAEKARGLPSRGEQEPALNAKSEPIERILALSHSCYPTSRVGRSEACPSPSLREQHFSVLSPGSVSASSCASGPFLRRYASYAASVADALEARRQD
jgi:glycosyltransferase involved in cell wall biosynthesis